jgi:nicotinamidase-related amidase
MSQRPILSANAALLLVDIQTGFDDPKWGPRNNLDAEVNAGVLLQAWRSSGRPVFHIQHASTLENSPLNPARDGFRFKNVVQPEPGETVLTKNVNSGFIGTNLEAELRIHGVSQVVIVGLTTPHCISTTTRMAGNLGFETYLVSDATAAFALTGPDGVRHDAETIHRVSLATLHKEFAEIVTTEMVLESLDVH